MGLTVAAVEVTDVEIVREDCSGHAALTGLGKEVDSVRRDLLGTDLGDRSAVEVLHFVEDGVADGFVGGVGRPDETGGDGGSVLAVVAHEVPDSRNLVEAEVLLHEVFVGGRGAVGEAVLVVAEARVDAELAVVEQVEGQVDRVEPAEGDVEGWLDVDDFGLHPGDVLEDQDEGDAEEGTQQLHQGRRPLPAYYLQVLVKQGAKLGHYIAITFPNSPE